MKTILCISYLKVKFKKKRSFVTVTNSLLAIVSFSHRPWTDAPPEKVMANQKHSLTSMRLDLTNL